MSVLVVDSDKIFREFVINNLLICGIKIYTVASSVAEALVKISENSFDIILINFSRPDINGLQLAGEFQNRMPDSKIILIIEDDQLSSLNSAGLVKMNLTTILKSSVSQMLPELLAEYI
jgi:DNA-binding NtrC family response regulator